MIAHLVTTGLGPVYDGIVHLLTTPEDLVPAIALSLYAGLRGAGAGRRVLFLLPAAWLAGGLAGLSFHAAISFPVGAVSLLFLGVLVAADAGWREGAVAGLAATLGLVHGFLDGTALSSNGSGAGGLAGTATALFVVVALVSSAVVAMKRPWARVAVRVAGSWIAAVGLLLLGWGLRAAR